MTVTILVFVILIWLTLVAIHARLVKIEENTRFPSIVNNTLNRND